VALILASIVLGVSLGLALGGSLRTLSDVRFRWWPLAIAGVALQAFSAFTAGEQRADDLGFALLLLSYGVLTAFGLVNLRKPGLPLVVLGLLLNAAVIAVNRGMPVTEEAIRRAAGDRYAEAIRDLQERGGAKHHLAGPDDRLVVLGDIIAIGPPIRGVYSVGDLCAYAGVAWALMAATKGPPGRHRFRRGRDRHSMVRGLGAASGGPLMQPVLTSVELPTSVEPPSAEPPGRDPP
jgi:hypothetical protein